MKTDKMITPSKSSKGKEYQRWEKSVKTGDKEKTLCVKEAENGFVITITENDWSKNYKHSEKVFISPTNPLEKEQPIKDSNEDIMKAIQEFNEMF